VVERVAERNRLRLRTTCLNQDGELLLEGEAWVLPSPTRIEYTAPRPAAAPGVVSPLFLPAAVAMEMASIWMTSGMTLASQALGLVPAAPARAGQVPATAEPDPVRP
jgi:hypothetical protein